MTYSEYVTKLFTVPLCVGLIALVVLIGLIFAFIKFKQSINRKARQKIGVLMLKALPFSFSIPVVFVFVLLAYSQLKMGIPLMTEKPEDAIDVIGKITEIKEDDLSRVTYDAEGNAVRAQYVDIGELQLYCADVGEFGEGDTVQVRYLPKSGVVLCIEEPTDQPLTPPAQQPAKQPLIDPAIGMILFTALFAATYLWNIVRFRGKRHYKQDAEWGRNTVELRYKDGPLFMGIRCIIAVIMLFCVPNSYLIGIAMILLAVIDPIRAGHKVPLTYDENGITITAVNGRSFFYKWDDVISVTQAYTPIFRLHPVPCVKVTYRTESGKEESMYYTLADHVGTSRFELYAEQYLGQKQN